MIKHTDTTKLCQQENIVSIKDQMLASFYILQQHLVSFTNVFQLSKKYVNLALAFKVFVFPCNDTMVQIRKEHPYFEHFLFGIITK